jgi:predicted nucleic acid-binding protein
VVIDANVLVSFFVERNEKQRVAGKALLLSAEEGEIVAVVPQFALFEIAYVATFDQKLWDPVATL